MLEENISYSKKYTLVELGKFLKRNKTSVDIEDDVIYKRVTIKTNNGGIFLRDIKNGKKVGTKKQFLISKGQFLLSKIDARNGAFGVVPPELDKAIITGNFWTFDVDYSMVNPHFLPLVTTTPEFIKFSENASNGTTNRHYLQENLFLSQRIPLPSLLEQNQLVENYNAKISEAEALEKQAQALEEGIEEYLFKKLGITKKKRVVFEKCKLNLFNYSDFIDRWDLNKVSMPILNNSSESIYPIISIGNVLKFESRPWNKKEWDSDFFQYIELSSIDPQNGIVKTSNVLIKKAPSRATQIVEYGDLIIGTTRPYLKKFAIVTDKDKNKIASSGFQIVAQEKGYNSHFILECLFSDLAIQQFEFYMTGALYPAITSKDLRKIQIPFPPLSLQDEIANHIQKIRDNIKKVRREANIMRKDAIKEFEKEIFE